MPPDGTTAFESDLRASHARTPIVRTIGRDAHPVSLVETHFGNDISLWPAISLCVSNGRCDHSASATSTVTAMTTGADWSGPLTSSMRSIGSFRLGSTLK